MTPEEAFEAMSAYYEAITKDSLRRPVKGPVTALSDEFNRVWKVGMEDLPLFEKLALSTLATPTASPSIVISSGSKRN